MYYVITYDYILCHEYLNNMVDKNHKLVSILVFDTLNDAETFIAINILPYTTFKKNVLSFLNEYGDLCVWCFYTNKNYILSIGNNHYQNVFIMNY